MIDIRDINFTPTLEELREYIRNPLFDKLCERLINDYKANMKIEFSKCSFEYGWNMKFKKCGKNLCTIYPRENFFTALIVIGSKEKEQTEQAMAEMSDAMREIYESVKEGNGQRWLMIDLEDENQLYFDALKLIEIRRSVK